MAAVRNLTAQFQKLRKDQKLKRNRFGYSLLKGDQTTNADSDYREVPLSSSGSTGIELRPIGNKEDTWTDLVSKTKIDISAIREKLAHLQKTQQRRLLKVFDENNVVGDPEIDAVTGEITRYFRACERKLEKLGSFEDSAPIRETVFNARRSLAAQLAKLNEEVRDVQRQYMREVRRRRHLGGTSDADVGTSGASLLDAAFTETQQAALEELETETETRSAEIAQIAQSVTELSRVFKQLANLVIEQGTLLDRIDYNIENVQEQTQQATVQLRKADEQQRQGSAMKCIFILLALIFLNLMILSAK